MVAAEVIEEGELVMRAPMRTTLSQVKSMNSHYTHSPMRTTLSQVQSINSHYTHSPMRTTLSQVMSINSHYTHSPMRTTLSQLTARNVKVGHGGYLGDRRHLRDAFKHNQAWGLAMMLLYECV